MSIMIWGTMIGISAAQMLILINKNGEINQNSDLSTNLQIYHDLSTSIHQQRSGSKQKKTWWPEAVSPPQWRSGGFWCWNPWRNPHPKDHVKVISPVFFLIHILLPTSPNSQPLAENHHHFWITLNHINIFWYVLILMELPEPPWNSIVSSSQHQAPVPRNSIAHACLLRPPSSAECGSLMNLRLGFFEWKNGRMALTSGTDKTL